MFLEIKNKFRKKAEKLYLWIFLCGNVHRLEEEKRLQEIEEENEVLREQYLKIIDRLRKLQEDNTIVLNKSVIERCKVYLGDDRYLAAIGCAQDDDPSLRDKKRRARVHEKIGANFKAQKNNYQTEGWKEVDGDEDDLRVEEQFMDGRDSEDEEIDIELENKRIGRLSTSPKKLGNLSSHKSDKFNFQK